MQLILITCSAFKSDVGASICQIPLPIGHGMYFTPKMLSNSFSVLCTMRLMIHVWHIVTENSALVLEALILDFGVSRPKGGSSELLSLCHSVESATEWRQIEKCLRASCTNQDGNWVKSGKLKLLVCCRYTPLWSRNLIKPNYTT